MIPSISLSLCMALLVLPFCQLNGPDLMSCNLRAGLEKERLWIAPHVHTPAAAPPGPDATRLRPLIYVYELPPIFNQVMLQVSFGGCLCRGGLCVGWQQEM